MPLFDDVLSLFFPRLCYVCDDSLRKNETILCTVCLNSLPKTNYHLRKDNPVAETFWGKVFLYSATACYYFHQSNKVQKLIHQLKYGNAKEIGVFIGEQMGPELLQSELFRTVEVIVPVPLHPKREKERGYNQSEMFAIGLSRGFDCPMNNKVLYRSKFTETQTRKSRMKRWENVENVFVIKNGENLVGKHILLVDDVITTGSTLEACACALMTIPKVTISIAAISTALKE